MDNFFAPPFAEIEIDTNTPPIPAPAPQSIGQRASDPVRQRFFDMRSLAGSNPFARNDADLFYKQAKYMEDFTDDYQGNEPFINYCPYYQQMGYEQLRTYFTWRARARGGEMPQTSLSYLYLYIYELLSQVGAEGPSGGLNKLMTVWTAGRDWEPSLDTYLPQWLKDYHICYELPGGFAEFVESFGLRRYYREAFFTTDDLLLWNGVSGYDVTKSKFFQAGNDTLLYDCFAAVLQAVRASGVVFERLLLYNAVKVPWRPFQNALARVPHKQPDRRVDMPGGETYICKDGNWTATLPIRNAGQKELVGYIIKKTEACLRHAVNYTFKIQADASVPFLPQELFTSVGATIERAVREFYADLTRTVVTVDHTNLARIRKEALGTQEKLTVPEAESGQPAPLLLPATPEPARGDTPRTPQTVESEALAVLLEGAKTLKQFAGERGVMPEILADSINEKAVDYFGDNLLDDDMAIYDEYKDKAREMARL